MILGVSGLFATEQEDFPLGTFEANYHDATACLVANGETLAAIEEERLNRDKHTNRFPMRAVKACFDITGVLPTEVTAVAYSFEEQYTNLEMQKVAVELPSMEVAPARDLLVRRLKECVGVDFEQVPVYFADHHLAHAASTFFESGFEDALVVVADGNSEKHSISIYLARDDELSLLKTHPRSASVGHFYTAATKLLGYRDFDEYKVMGMASYGDPEPFRDLMTSQYELLTDGEYALDITRLIPHMLEAGVVPRRRSDDIVNTHHDFAAAVQEASEAILFHVLAHWRRQTESTNLCFAGGVAQNTTFNGKLLSSHLFQSVFVPAWPHDGGAALGAAIAVDAMTQPGTRRASHSYSRSAYLGRDIGTAEQVGRALEAWDGFVRAERHDDDLEPVVADLLAHGAVVAWAQGRAEFGPRALGNRSILADPRPEANKDKINAVIKKREAYRPFAPVVLEPRAREFFALPDVTADYDFMGFVVQVRPEKRGDLGAVTHIDGTARVQVLGRGVNDRLWNLLTAFDELTSVPVLLNTSFNNFAEPIVDSVDDAVACLLTSSLSYLAIGPYLVQRDPEWRDAFVSSRLEISPFCEIVTRTSRFGDQTYAMRTSRPYETHPVSTALATVVRHGGVLSEAELDDDDRPSVLDEAVDLWDRRMIRCAGPG